VYVCLGGTLMIVCFLPPLLLLLLYIGKRPLGGALDEGLQSLTSLE